MNLGNLLCAFIVAFFLYIMKKNRHYATGLHKLQKRKPRIRDRYIFRVKNIIFNMTNKTKKLEAM